MSPITLATSDEEGLELVLSFRKRTKITIVSVKRNKASKKLESNKLK